MILALLLAAYAVSTYSLWIWRLTVDLSPDDVAFVAAAFMLTAGLTFWNQLISAACSYRRALPS